MDGKNNEVKEEVIEVKGMSCKSCVEKIEGKLLQLKGVKKARVSLVDEKAYVSFDPKQISIDKIKEEIKNLGYKVDGKNIEKSSVIKQGIFYGLMPHSCCIGFILASVFGVTVATEFFKPLLLNPYFFHILIILSLVFATISAILYLRKQGFITFSRNEGGIEINFYSDAIKRKWKYLSTLYGSTIGVNLLLFMVIFPILANFSIIPAATASFNSLNNGNANSISSIRLRVDIPCPGHAPLISRELRSIDGVLEVKFSFPNIFDVKYDPTRTSKQQILSLDVFETYKAISLENSNTQQDTQQYDNQANNIVGGCCGGTSCGCTVRS